MNKINKIFEEKYVSDLLKRKVLPLYKNFRSLKEVQIIPHKKHVWDTTYHVVVELRAIFVDTKQREHLLPIFCSAHSEENRSFVFEALDFLWSNGFQNEHLTIPRPLFYSPYLNGTFYRGVTGKTLYHFIKNKKITEIEKIIPQAAKWFAKLHGLTNTANFIGNEVNSRLRTVIPGVEQILTEIDERYPHYSGFYKRAYGIVIKKEEDFLASTSKRWLIHGDAHPDNIVKINDIKTAMIDFTDMSLADFTRDLGCFLQQVEYMASKKNFPPDYAHQLQELFLENYFANSSEKLDNQVQERIDNYYNWTTLRTITYLLTSGVINRDEAKMNRINTMINRLKDNLGI